MGLDGISLPLVVLTAFVSLLAMGASWSITKYVKGYCILFLLLETGMLGVFLALDFFLFYVFWEVMLLPMYFLIGVWGGPRQEYAAIKFFLYTLLGSVLMLIAILMLYFNSDLTDPAAAAAPGQVLSRIAVAEADVEAAMSRARSPTTANVAADPHVQHHGPAADRPAHDAARRLRATKPQRSFFGQRLAVVGVPAAVHRLRHQGAERPGPHLAARCPRRGADADLA